MRFRTTQLQLISILSYLCGLVAVCVAMVLDPKPKPYLAWSLASPALIGAGSFAFGYFKQFRRYRDIALDYSGMQFVFFVLCRPLIPLAFTAWALYSVWSGDWLDRANAMMGFAIFFSICLAEFLRRKQNGPQAEE